MDNHHLDAESSFLQPVERVPARALQRISQSASAAAIYSGRIGLVDQEIDGEIAKQLRIVRFVLAVVSQGLLELGAGHLVLGVDLPAQGGDAFIGDAMTERNIHGAPRKNKVRYCCMKEVYFA